MEIYNSGDAQQKPSVVMLVYGQGGVGKSTFAATAPKPIMADCENGAKYFGMRGIKMDIAKISEWPDIEKFYLHIKNSDYETIIIDPIGELMEKLKKHVVATNNKKFVQFDGSLSIAGWGELKDKLRALVKSIRDLGKHVIIIGHVEEKEDDGRIVKRPKIMTKISEEIIAMVDIVGYMETITVEGESKRIIRVQPSDRYEAKDRTNQLGPIIEPDFSKIVRACQGTETFKWSKQKAGTPPTTPPNTAPAAPGEAEAPKEEPTPAEDKKSKLKAKMASKKDAKK